MTNYFSIFISLFLAALLSGCTSTESSSYWENQVEELCQAHGGVRVFEKVTLTREEFKNLLDKNNKLAIPEKSKATAEDPYFIRKKDFMLVQNNDVAVKRIHISIWRQEDNKRLSELIFWNGIKSKFASKSAEPFNCSNTPNINLDLIGSTFELEKKK